MTTESEEQTTTVSAQAHIIPSGAASNSMLRFGATREPMTIGSEEQTTTASARAHIIPTGAATNSMLRFGATREPITPESEEQTTTAPARAQTIPTGAVTPQNNQGAVVLESITELTIQVYELSQQVSKLSQGREEEGTRRIELEKRLEEADLVIANHVALTNNMLREYGMLQRGPDQIESAHTLLHQCQVCYTRHRSMRLVPCRHMAMCAECADTAVRTRSKCPLCKFPVVGARQRWQS